MEQFLNDVLKGLQSHPKFLQSKYFYDKEGDRLFQKIMASKDYYLTNSEMEILKTQKKQIANSICKKNQKLDLVEFGPGDAVKSIHLIGELVGRNCIDHYIPIDISENIIQLLEKKFMRKFPKLNFSGMNGEYLSMLSEVNTKTSNPKIVLFLGANIGNFLPEAMLYFVKKLSAELSPGDMVLIGFDLKKDPDKILAAYNDREGYTTKFNLNLLTRINRELKGNFKVSQFRHFRNYDPGTGSCKSYLISKKDQEVKIGNARIRFQKDEPIFMEISQKYELSQIEEAATAAGFVQKKVFADKKNYFADVLWQKK